MKGNQSPRSSNPQPDPLDLQPALRRYFLKRTNPADAEDLVQEVLTRLQARKAPGEINNMASYVFAIASNVLKETRGKADRYALGGTDIEGADWFTPERILAGRMDIKRLMVAIEALPERTRRVFVAHRFEDMTYGAIAALFGISVSAVEKHIMAALVGLTAALRQGDR